MPQRSQTDCARVVAHAQAAEDVARARRHGGVERVEEAVRGAGRLEHLEHLAACRTPTRRARRRGSCTSGAAPAGRRRRARCGSRSTRLVGCGASSPCMIITRDVRVERALHQELLERHADEAGRTAPPPDAGSRCAALIGSDEVPNSMTPPSGRSGRSAAPPSVTPRKSVMPLVTERPRSPCRRCLKMPTPMVWKWNIMWRPRWPLELPTPGPSGIGEQAQAHALDGAGGEDARSRRSPSAAARRCRRTRRR